MRAPSVPPASPRGCGEGPLNLSAEKPVSWRSYSRAQLCPISHRPQHNYNMAAVSPAKPINPVLASYLRSLAARPLLTKACTSAVLSFLQEITAGKLAGATPPPLSAKERTGVPPVDWLIRNQRALKLALYGFAVSAPLSHVLTGKLQQAFAGRTSPRDRVLMIICQLVLISPITSSAYVASLAIIAGAKTFGAVSAAVKGSFVKMMKLSAVMNPLSLVIAQNFVPPELWVPWFNFVVFCAGTTINYQVKKKQAAVAKAKKNAEDKAE